MATETWNMTTDANYPKFRAGTCSGPGRTASGDQQCCLFPPSWGGGARGGLCPPEFLAKFPCPPAIPPDLRKNLQDFRKFLPKSMKIVRKLDLVTEKAKNFRLRRAKKAKYLHFLSFSEFWSDLGGSVPPPEF